MSALKSHSPDGIAPAHMVVEALDTRLDMDIKTNAGQEGAAVPATLPEWIHCDW